MLNFQSFTFSLRQKSEQDPRRQSSCPLFYPSAIVMTPVHFLINSCHIKIPRNLGVKRLSLQYLPKIHSCGLGHGVKHLLHHGSAAAGYLADTA